MKTKLSSVLLAAAVLLASCAQRSADPAPRPATVGASIYDPDELRLRAGVPVATADGVFTPPVDTVYFSARVVGRLNDQLLRWGGGGGK